MDSELLSVSAELAEVTRLLEDDDTSAVLERYVSRVVQAVPGCDHAAVTVGTADVLETVVGAWEPFAYDANVPAARINPIREAVLYREPRRLPDAQSERRWRAFADQLMEVGFQSCLILPLPSSVEPAAVFTLLARKPHQFGDDAFDLGLFFTLHAGVAFDNVTLYNDCRTLVARLHTSLQSRSVIGRAQGLIMHRDGCSSEEAFDTLRQASQRHNVKLRDIASALVAAQEQNELESTLARLDLNG